MVGRSDQGARRRIGRGIDRDGSGLNSAIVVTSDHGTARFPRSDSPLAAFASPAGMSLHALELNATPLLLVKPFGAEGPLRTSDAPTAMADLPATLLDLAKLPNTLGTGTSVLALDPVRRRERTYAHHSWGLGLTANTWAGPWFDVLHLFTVEGRVGDPPRGATGRRSSDRPETGKHNAGRIASG